MSKPWIFVCPASRGIGHALTRHLLQTTNLPILATTHRTDPEKVRSSLLLNSSNNNDKNKNNYKNRLHILPLDVTSEPSIRSASDKAAQLFPPSPPPSSSEKEKWHLHLAFALPGILTLPPEKSPKQVDYEKSLETFKVNTLGQLMLMKWFGERFLPKNFSSSSDSSSPFLFPPEEEEGREMMKISRNHATYLAASARVGSTTDNKSGGWYSYRASKAGVISLVKGFDHFLRMRSSTSTSTSSTSEEGQKKNKKSASMAIAYHPGTVKTDLSKEFWGSVPEEKLFTPEFAAARMADIVSSSGEEEGKGGGGGVGFEGRGRCWDWKGEEVLP